MVLKEAKQIISYRINDNNWGENIKNTLLNQISGILDF
jgi:hypothetical protein